MAPFILSFVKENLHSPYLLFYRKKHEIHRWGFFAIEIILHATKMVWVLFLIVCLGLFFFSSECTQAG